MLRNGYGDAGKDTYNPHPVGLDNLQKEIQQSGYKGYDLYDLYKRHIGFREPL